jgi:hypothetical protein
MNKWTRTISARMPKAPIPGVYSAFTESGKRVYGFSYSADDAYNNLISGVPFNDRIVHISRETFNEEY